MLVLVFCGTLVLLPSLIFSALQSQNDNLEPRFTARVGFVCLLLACTLFARQEIFIAAVFAGLLYVWWVHWALPALQEPFDVLQACVFMALPGVLLGVPFGTLAGLSGPALALGWAAREGFLRRSESEASDGLKLLLSALMLGLPLGLFAFSCLLNGYALSNAGGPGLPGLWLRDLL